MHQNLFLVRIG